MKSKLNVVWLTTLLFSLNLMAGCASGPTALVDKDPTRIICRDEPDTGSRLPKRTCKEAREWEAIAEANQLAKRNLRRRSVDGSAEGLD